MRLLLLFLLGTLWGSGYTLARFATTHGVQPLGYSFWQSLGPALFVIILTKIKHVPPKKQSSFIGFCIITGILGIAIPNTNMYFVSKHLPAGLLAILVNTVPLMTYFISFLLRIERFYLFRLIGVLIGFIGISFFTLPYATFPTSHEIKWTLLLLLTPLCFSLCAIYVTLKRPQDYDTLTLTKGMLVCSTLVLLPVVIATQQFYYFKWPLTLADGAIFLEIILSSLGYLIFFQLLKIAGPVYYSLVGGVVMITGLFWGWLVFNETLNIWSSFGTLFILLGIYLVTLFKSASVGRSADSGTTCNSQ